MLAFPWLRGAIWRPWRQLWRQGWPEPSLWWWRMQRRWQSWRDQPDVLGAPLSVTGRRRLVWSTAVLLSAPAALILAWSAWNERTLDGFDDRVEAVDPRLAHLLAGEQLSPPAPLPPEVFATAEVEIERPMTATADRRWEQLQPAFMQRLLRIFKVMQDEHGYELVLLEGYRSPQRQAQLAAQGTHVTMAGAWQSYHQYGVAADVAFWRDGRVVISEKDDWAARGYERLGQVAEAHGLTWGGRWRMRDLGHVEWRTPEVQQAMRAARRAPPAPAFEADTSGNTNTP
ncbi:M15 family metallopeptidase [Aquabacterium sp. A3]|uniref:M15 family metallopeptidase n=1 Tax=Aquabacterium sp. A3 TaxID=3132829 RepID=UPI003119D627